MTREIPNIWNVAGPIADAYRVLSEADLSKHREFWKDFLESIKQLPIYDGKEPLQIEGIAATKLKLVLQTFIPEMKVAFLRHLIKLVPGLKFPDEDKAVRDAKLQIDADVIKDLFEEVYGVKITIDRT